MKKDPNIIPENFLNDLNSIFEPHQIVADSVKVEELSRSSTPFRQIPKVFVFPENIEQVQKLIEFAKKVDVPLWPVSTGKNWGYGEKTAPYEGGITVMLERMNRIIEVNEKLAYAVLEPGVTYKQLNDYLKERNIPLWADCTGSTEAASVLGNALDKGRGLTPYADHFGALCGLDVVLPDGRTLQTGGGAENNYHCRHTYKWGISPYLDGLFAQSNLGIVVRAGVWLMPKPEKFDFISFEYSAGSEKFSSFIEDFRSLFFKGAIRSFPHLANDFAMLCIVDQYPRPWLDGKKMLTRENLQKWKDKHGVKDWTFGCGLYGSRDQVNYQKNEIKRVLSRYGKVRFLGRSLDSNIFGRLLFKITIWGAKLVGKSDQVIAAIAPAINLYQGIPSDEFAKQVYFKNFAKKPSGPIDPPKDGSGFIWIGPLVPFESSHVQKILDIAKTSFHKFEFEVFVELIVESPRSLIALFGVFYDQKNPEETERAKQWYFEIRKNCAEGGYPAYRTSTYSSQSTLDSNLSQKKLMSDIKRSVDPSNILAPGRYGVGLNSN